MPRHRNRLRMPGVLAIIVAVVLVGGGIFVWSTFFRGSDDDRFYRLPFPFRSGEPGEIVRSERVRRGDRGTRTFRVMYHSRSLRGDDIAVTGVLIIPGGPVPKGGRPVVTVGHPSTGVADECAPSRDFEDAGALLNQFLVRGWVVAISDYEGQGPPGRHPYLVGESEARSLLDIARAARRFPAAHAGKRVAVWGHSQGGHAALFAQQFAEAYAPELELVGSVAAAPVASVGDFVAASGFGGASVPFLAIAGYSAAYPELRPEQVLSDAALEKLPLVDEACLGYFGEKLDDLDPADVYRVDLAKATAWQKRLAENEAGGVAREPSVLVIHGEVDQVIPLDSSVKLFARMCRAGQAVELRRVPGVDHGGIVDKTADEVTAWIADRFAGKPARSTCAGG